MHNNLNSAETQMCCADIPQQDSPAAKFPLAAYAPYSQPGFVWNPFGTGLALEEFTFPIMLLDNNTAPQAADKAAYNAQRVSILPYNARRVSILPLDRPSEKHVCCIPPLAACRLILMGTSCPNFMNACLLCMRSCDTCMYLNQLPF